MSALSNGSEVLAHLRYGPHTIPELVEATGLSSWQVWNGRCWLIDTIDNAGITIPANYGHKAVSDARPLTHRDEFTCGACAAVYADPADAVLAAGWGNYYRLAVNVSEAMLDALVVLKYVTTSLKRSVTRLEQHVASPVIQSDPDYDDLNVLRGLLSGMGDAGAALLRRVRVMMGLPPE